MTTEQWLLGALAALIVGFTKTGVPGVGILVVPIMATAFGGWASVGLTLPMLIFGDLFAVLWYRRHARWDKLGGLIPWVLLGITAGAVLLFVLGQTAATQLGLNPIIGALVLVMLAINLARRRWSNQLVPSSPAGLIITGASAGFTTTISNAAGPIMAIYLTSLKLPKEQFMGTSAWYFFIFNLTKLPIYILLTLIHPQAPLVTLESLSLNALLIPAIVAGAFLGKWLLPRIPQALFDFLALGLAGIAALRLLFS
jgi:uncharacterized membrane protein YfcA